MHQLLVLVPKANIMFAPFFLILRLINIANANVQVDVLLNYKIDSSDNFLLKVKSKFMNYSRFVSNKIFFQKRKSVG